jgi:hypothetical protein
MRFCIKAKCKDGEILYRRNTPEAALKKAREMSQTGLRHPHHNARRTRLPFVGVCRSTSHARCAAIISAVPGPIGFNCDQDFARPSAFSPSWKRQAPSQFKVGCAPGGSGRTGLFGVRTGARAVTCSGINSELVCVNNQLTNAELVSFIGTLFFRRPIELRQRLTYFVLRLCL